MIEFPELWAPSSRFIPLHVETFWESTPSAMEKPREAMWLAAFGYVEATMHPGGEGVHLIHICTSPALAIRCTIASLHTSGTSGLYHCNRMSYNGNVGINKINFEKTSCNTYTLFTAISGVL